jgi:hypothetical protein
MKKYDRVPNRDPEKFGYQIAKIYLDISKYLDKIWLFFVRKALLTNIKYPKILHNRDNRDK